MTEETLFAEAAAKPPEERSAFLDDACGDDAALRERVEVLLRSHVEAGSFLANSAEEDFDATLDISVDDQALISARSAELRKSQAEKPVQPAPGQNVDDHEPPSVSVVVEPSGKRILYFGDYELQGEIARGAMGVVYRAEQASLKRIVAIKMIRSTLLASGDDVTRFKAEAEAAASLDHPNIVPIYEVGMHEEQHYFTMKLIEGGTLRSHLERLQKDPRAAAKLMTTVAGAIHTAHQRGILHRDLKPGNILIDEEGEPHVTDFGLAKQMESNSSVTLSGQIMGTPQYMAPEQAEGGGKDLTTAADVYALGAIFYEMLCGRPPHQGESLMETLKLVAEEEAAAASKYHPKVDRDLETIAMKCLEKDPARRYASAQGLKNDLDRWLRGEPIEARPVGTAEKVIKWMKRKPMHAAAAAIGALFLLTLGIGGPVWALQQARLRTQADEARTLAEKREGETRVALARSALSLAEASLREANGPAMRGALEDVPEDLRDSTWRYLFRQSDSSIARIQAGGPAIEGAAADPSRPGVFAVTDRSGRVTLVHVASGERLLEFQSEFSEKAATSGYRLAFSPDGRLLAVARGGPGDPESKAGDSVHRWRHEVQQHRPGGIVIHRARDGQKVREWATPSSDHLEFGGSDKLLRWGAGSLQVWNPGTGTLLWERQIKGNIGVKGIFTPDASAVVQFTFKDRLQLVRAADGGLIRNLGGRGAVYDWYMAVRPDGLALFTITESRVTECVSLEDGRTLFTLPQKRPRYEMGFTGNGSQLVTLAALPDGRQSIEVWNAQTGDPIRSVLGGQGEVTDLGIHPRSNELLVTGPDSRAWNLTGPLPKWRPLGGPHENYSVFAFWGADDLVIGASGGPADFGVKRLLPSGMEDVWRPEIRKMHTSAVSADGSTAFLARAGYSDEVLLLRKTASSVEEFGRVRTGFDPYRLRPSASGGRFVAMGRATRSTQAAIFDIASGQIAVKPELPGVKRLSDMRWAGEDRLVGLVTVKVLRGNPGAEERVILWDAANGKVLQSVPHPTAMDVLAISPDGSRFAEAGADKMVRIRDTATLAVLQEFRAHDAPITGLAWHPTRSVLATASDDFSVKLWDLAAGRRITTFRGMVHPLKDLAFSPTGRRLGVQTYNFGGGQSYGRIWQLEGDVLADLLAAASVPKPAALILAPPPTFAEIAKEFWGERASDPFVAKLLDSGWKESALQKKDDGTWKADLSGLEDFRALEIFEGTPVSSLNLARTGVTDLGPLRGMPIEELILRETQIADLSPLAGMPLRVLHLQRTAVTDLGPLADMPLEILMLLETRVADLTVLRGMPLKELELWGCTQLTDLSPLAEAAELECLLLPPMVGDIAFLRGLPKLARLSFNQTGKAQDRTAARFWEQYDAGITDYAATEKAKRNPGHLLIAAGRTAEALPLMVEASTDTPSNTHLASIVAALQMWFGEDDDHTATSKRMLDWAAGRESDQSAMNASRLAKLVCLGRTGDAGTREAALGLARKALDLGKENREMLSRYQMTLGMAEYRSGHFQEAEAVLNAVPGSITADTFTPKAIEGTAAFYRAMSLFQLDRKDEARALFTAAEAAMKPLPADNSNPGADPNHLILWLACKEAKALLASAETP